MEKRVKENCIALAKRPQLWAVLALLLWAGYGWAAQHPAVGIDDLAIDYYQRQGGFLLQSRVTVWLLQAATGILTYQPFWPELFAAVGFALCGVVLAAVLYAAAGEKPRTGGALLLAGGVLLYPFHGEILAYSNQCGMGFAMLLAALALAVGCGHILQGRRFGGAAAMVVLLTFSLGYYESMAQVWLTLLFALLLTEAVARPPRSRRMAAVLPAILRGIWPLAAALMLRGLLAKLLCALMGITGSDGAAAKTIYWFRRESIGEALRIFLREFLTNYLVLPFGVPALLLLDIACAALVVWAVLRRTGNGKGLLVLGLLGSIFAMGILQGTGSQMARACQCFAVFVPFTAWLLLRSLLPEQAAELTQPKRLGALVLAAALVLTELVSLRQTFRFDRRRWQYEAALLQEISGELDALDPARTQPVVFCGEVALPEELRQELILPAGSPAYKVAYLLSVTLGSPMGDIYRYEEVNESVINWALVAFGNSDQMYLIMEELGRPCVKPSPAQQAEGFAATAQPSGSVSQQDGFLLVKF